MKIFAALAIAIVTATADRVDKTEIRFIAQALIKTGTTFDNTEVGGLSGLDYLPWYAHCIIVVSLSNVTLSQVKNKKLNLKKNRIPLSLQ
jgi:hypothetical protein